jgi:glycosyltransferase involved in cell wall biosynthesis
LSKSVWIVSYYWPPAGGSGVQRWVKQARYLDEAGWRVQVCCPEQPDIPDSDASLAEEIPPSVRVHRRPIVEPYGLYRKVFRKKESAVRLDRIGDSRSDRIATWVRGNLFIPDPRVGWAAPTAAWLARQLRKDPVDVVVTTGPPHSVHLIGLALKRMLGQPWVADLRDPWTGWAYLDNLPISPPARSVHRVAERAVLRSADLVVTVSESWASDLRDLGARRCEVVTNGFDPRDFESAALPDDGRFRISHVGNMHGPANPTALWRALAHLVDDEPGLADELTIELVGPENPTATEELRAFGLQRFVDAPGSVPHAEAVKRMRRASVLLLTLGPLPGFVGCLPGKAFEYLAARRPILSVSEPGGEVARFLDQTGAGESLAHNDEAGLRDAVRGLYRRHRAGDLEVPALDLTPWTRRALVEKYGRLLTQAGR